MTRVRTAINIGSEIRAARNARKLTQKQLAELAGVHQPKISEIERGKATAQIGIVLRIVDALGLIIELSDGRSAQETHQPPQPSAARVLLEEPLPDDSIDLDTILNPGRK